MGTDNKRGWLWGVFLLLTVVGSHAYSPLLLADTLFSLKTAIINSDSPIPASFDTSYFLKDPTWSPDGHKIAVAAIQSGGGQADLIECTVKADGTGLESNSCLTLVSVYATGACSSSCVNLEKPKYSPDGSAIAYISDELKGVGVQMALYRYSDGGSTKVSSGVHVLPYYDGTYHKGWSYVDWSPDSTSIIYRAQTETGENKSDAIYVASQTAMNKLLTCSGDCTAISYAKDGSGFFYSLRESDGSSSVWFAALDVIDGEPVLKAYTDGSANPVQITLDYAKPLLVGAISRSGDDYMLYAAEVTGSDLTSSTYELMSMGYFSVTQTVADQVLAGSELKYAYTNGTPSENSQYSISPNGGYVFYDVLNSDSYITAIHYLDLGNNSDYAPIVLDCADSNQYLDHALSRVGHGAFEANDYVACYENCENKGESDCASTCSTPDNYDVFVYAALDFDGDSVSGDLCPELADSDNADQDGDGVGDVCDSCPSDSNATQVDSDGDGIGDVCDGDRDDDGVVDTADNCPTVANPDQLNTDGDTYDSSNPKTGGDVCDDDIDDDGDSNSFDNCPSAENADQSDHDLDGVGDVCDPCPYWGPEVGDSCGDDYDQDGIVDGEDPDADGDGYNNANADGNDCDDLNNNVYPDAVEIGDGVDNDCDGVIDEGTTLFDDDGDGKSESTGDCDDNDASVYLGAAEIADDGIDQDCNGTDLTDVDGDTYTVAAGDCDDSNVSVYPGATETANNVDDDCDGSTDEGTGTGDDLDSDGFTTAAGDCNDADAEVNPGATEQCGDSIDNDCDTVINEGCSVTECGEVDDPLPYYADVDGDGYGDPATEVSTCGGAPTGYITDASDCDDTTAAVNPNATEVTNGIDDDCDGVIDGVDDTEIDITVEGDCDADDVDCDDDRYSEADGDCDDGDADQFPGNDEVDDNKDNDCDGFVDESSQRICTTGDTSCNEDDGDTGATESGGCSLIQA